jgi:predicted metalloendopeptidase
MKRYAFAVISAVTSFLILASCGNPSSVQSSVTASSSLVSSSSSSVSVSSQSSIAEKGNLEKLADKIVSNAAREGVNITTNQLLEKASYNGNEEVTKSRFFNLLYLTFKDSMPEHVGARVYEGAPEVKYASVPTEASSAVEFLNSRGLLTPEYDSEGKAIDSFNGDEICSQSLINTYLDRFHAYIGKSEVDDFHNADNYDFLFNNPKYADKKASDSFSDTNIVSSSAITSWVQKRISEMPEGERKTNINTYVTSYNDVSSKVANNCSGAFSNYQKVADCTDFASLFKLSASLYKSQGSELFFDRISMDSGMSILGKAVLEIIPFNSLNTSDEFAEGTAVYKKHLSDFHDVFLGVGFAEDKAASYAASAVKAEAQIVKEKETVDADPVLSAQFKTSNLLLDDKSPIGPQNFSLYDYLLSSGMKDITIPYTNEDGTITNILGAVPLYGDWYYAYFNSMTDANFEGFRALALFNQINNCLPCNPYSVVKLLRPSAEEDYLSQAYASSSFLLPGIENDVISYYESTLAYSNNVAECIKAFSDIREAFNKRLENSSWLSEEGKSSAKAKADGMRYMMMGTRSNGKEVDVSSIAYSGSAFYSNYCLAKSYKMAKINSLVGKSTRDDDYIYHNSPFTANAFYNSNSNSFTILFGYLAAHDDFHSISTEQRFAHLYWCLGHEFSHGFDASGIKYDKNGDYNENLWSKEDQAAYAERTQKVIDFYDGYEVMPGKKTSGLLTITEDGADCAGLRLSLDLAKNIAGFDYKAFFKEAGRVFTSLASRSAYEENNESDVHPFGRARLNRAFSALPEFISAYSVTEGDMMYVAPDKQPLVW